MSATLLHSLQLLSPRGVCQTVMLWTLNSGAGCAVALPSLKLAVSSATTASLQCDKTSMMCGSAHVRVLE